MAKKATARVSARTTSMDVTQTYGTKYAIPTWLRDEQIRLAIKKVKGRVAPLNELRTDPIAVVGFGPSLQDTWEAIKDFRYVMTCSGAHRFLIDRGIIPTWHTAVDPLPRNTVELIGPPHPDVEYLISSTTHPDVLDHLAHNQVKLWHVFTNEEEGNRILPPGEWAVTGGADVGIRSLVLARLLGFTTIHAFGLDGSGKAQGESHAAAHPSTPSKMFPCEFPPGSGKMWLTTPAMLSCAKSVPHEVDQLKDATITFHGEGLIQAMMQAHVPKKPKTADLAFIKPLLISEDYRTLNAHLHATNPTYGTSGVKYVDTVLKLAKGMPTQSILDYGCGKGLLAKGMPFPIWEYDPAIEGKQELPRPAELVVCTDVLEHLEPEMLMAVLFDLARCTQKVGYFVIHTGAAQKTLADGRNAHLIQKPKAWWEKQLKKVFDVATMAEDGQSLQVVVGPKTAAEKKDWTTVTHADTTASFWTPNETLKWRVKTLFTKEPCTIAWIDTFQPGDVLWDIGANMGGYAVWAGKHKGTEVYAFEPEADTYAVLCRNLRQNNIHGLAYCLAMTDTLVLSTLFLSKAEAGGSCHSFGQNVGPDLQPRDGLKQGAVGMTLDQVMDLVPLPHHVKIDVDGFEHLVLAGGKRLLAHDHLKSLLIEVNTHLPEHQQMLTVLGDLGFVYDQAQVDASMRKEGMFEGCAEYVFSKVSDIEKAVLDRIRDTPLTMQPFPHLVIDEFFPKAYFESMTWPTEGWALLSEARGTHGYPERSVALAPTALSWMRSGRLRKALDAKFGVLSVSDEMLMLQDAPGYTIPPHTDTPSKAVTALIYVGGTPHGTSLYAPNIDFSDPKGLHHDRDTFTEVVQVSGKSNTAFIFARTDTSFHGTEPYQGPGLRTTLLYDTRR